MEGIMGQTASRHLWNDKGLMRQLFKSRAGKIDILMDE